MQNDHETILAALFNLVVSSVIVNFTAQATAGNPTLTNVSSTKGFFTGLPVFGPGIVDGSTIETFTSTSVTLSENATANETAGTAFSTGFQDSGRRVVPWGKQKLFPCLFLRHTTDEDVYVNTILQKTLINAEIWIYSKVGPDKVQDTALNYLVTAVRSALASDVRANPQTLGGLCFYARVEGESIFDPGDLDQIGKASIPVKILCP